VTHEEKTFHFFLSRPKKVKKGVKKIKLLLLLLLYMATFLRVKH
jgi:hypothetical protein